MTEDSETKGGKCPVSEGVYRPCACVTLAAISVSARGIRKIQDMCLVSYGVECNLFLS